ncbi:MAG: hypothetical protein LLF89_00290, partial [Spirochaetaceae bacterium]|nr:hypothetical protein [Spirochaetaceae bacterium]
ILKQDGGFSRLAHREYPWKRNKDYSLSLEIVGDRITLSIDGEVVLEAHDDSYGTGMSGCGAIRCARALYGPFLIEEL